MYNAWPLRLPSAQNVVALLVLLAAGSGGLHARNDPPADGPTPPEDHSLTADDYLKLGLPASDRAWTGVEMGRAADALAELADKHPEQLPRYGSKRSGDLFDRITSAQNLELCRDKSLPLQTRMQNALGLIGAGGRILKLYLKPFLDKKTADSEMVELMGSMLRTSTALMDVTDEFVRTLDKTDPTYATRMAGLETMKKGLAGVVAGSIQTLTERSAYRDSELIRLTGYMRDTLPTLVPRLLPGSRKETVVRLETLDKDDSMKELQPGLHELLSKVKGALDSDPAP